MGSTWLHSILWMGVSIKEAGTMSVVMDPLTRVQLTKNTFGSCFLWMVWRQWQQTFPLLGILFTELWGSPTFYLQHERTWFWEKNRRSPIWWKPRTQMARPARTWEATDGICFVRGPGLRWGGMGDCLGTFGGEFLRDFWDNRLGGWLDCLFFGICCYIQLLRWQCGWVKILSLKTVQYQLIFVQCCSCSVEGGLVSSRSELLSLDCWRKGLPVHLDLASRGHLHAFLEMGNSNKACLVETIWIIMTIQPVVGSFLRQAKNKKQQIVGLLFFNHGDVHPARCRFLGRCFRYRNQGVSIDEGTHGGKWINSSGPSGVEHRGRGRENQKAQKIRGPMYKRNARKLSPKHQVGTHIDVKWDEKMLPPKEGMSQPLLEDSFMSCTQCYCLRASKRFSSGAQFASMTCARCLHNWVLSSHSKSLDLTKRYCWS